MSELKILDKTFVPFIEEALVQQKIKELATQLNKEYEGKQPLFLSILNGAFMFSADLFKHITIEAEICFIKLAKERCRMLPLPPKSSETMFLRFF